MPIGIARLVGTLADGPWLEAQGAEEGTLGGARAHGYHRFFQLLGRTDFDLFVDDLWLRLGLRGQAGERSATFDRIKAGLRPDHRFGHRGRIEKGGNLCLGEFQFLAAAMEGEVGLITAQGKEESVVVVEAGLDLLDQSSLALLRRIVARDPGFPEEISNPEVLHVSGSGDMILLRELWNLLSGREL